MLKPLDAIGPADAALVGGKAFNCARLKQAGFPVPDGIVLSAGAAAVEIDRLRDSLWMQAQPPAATFAVRSSGVGEDSAGHSFAGIHETRLNVTREDLAAAISGCLRSADSAQARAYRASRALGDEQAVIAVLVQRMVPASISGVAFTINPVTGADELVVNAAWGPGEALVSGQVDPDELRIRKSDRRPVSQRLGVKGGNAPTAAALTPAQVDELARLLLRIEQHYGAPQDVEWCHDGRAFWIVQSRPVTTAADPGSTKCEPGRTDVGEDTDIEWTRANVVEVLPDQLSPQALAAFETLLNLGERRFMGRLVAPESELGPIIRSFHGRLYFNLSQLRRVCRMAGAPPADMLRSFGNSDEIHPDDEIGAWPPLVDLLRCLPDFVRLLSYDIRMASLVRRHEARTAAIVSKLGGVDPRLLPDRELWAFVRHWSGEVPRDMQIVFVVGSVMMREGMIRKACNAVGFAYDRLVYPQLAAGARSVSTQQAVDLVALADVARGEAKAAAYLRANDGAFRDFREALAGTAFLERLDRFLDSYGHRGRYESDWALPRLHENPAPVLFAIRGHLEGPAQNLQAIAERQETDAAAAWQAFEARMTWWQRRTRLPRVRRELRRLKQQYVWREQVRSDLTRIIAHLRRWFLVLADRFVERGWIERRDDYFLLRLDEIGAAIDDPAKGEGLRKIAARRTAELEAQRPLRMPLLMRESQLSALVNGPPVTRAADGPVLTGLCVSPGSVEAEVVVMRDPAEFASMKRGAILVAPATDPSWTPLFTLAAGVIVEVGGMLSHASTIARELGLPALANVKDATRALKTGDHVKLDASGGRVLRISSSAGRGGDQASTALAAPAV
jgi:phosphohistidine swiveling domain-containing protein